MAMILPVTFWIPPVGALIMLAGVFLRCAIWRLDHRHPGQIPGETSSVHHYPRWSCHGAAWRAGPALAIAALGSCSRLRGDVVIAIGGPPLAKVALLFQSADYVSVMVLGLVSAVVLAHGSVLKAVGMIVSASMLGLVGTDVSTGDTA